MAQPNELPQFRGDISPEEAELWFQTLVAATGSFTESGLFRLLSSKIGRGSPAREWFDGIKTEAKTSWTVFENHFHDRWVTKPRLQAQEDSKWDEFRLHRLADDEIFSDLSDVASRGSDIVQSWVDSHYTLGKATGRCDEELIQQTDPLLPDFIHAYVMMFHSSPGLETFQEYCEYIKGLAQEGIIHWQTEWYRRLKSSNDSSSLISKVDEITKKLDKIQMRLGELSAAVGTTLSHQSHIQPTRLGQNSNENILWEPCSPLTSVVTEDGMSVVATPKGQQSSLPNVEAEPPNNAEPETTSMPIPQQWRKPSITLNKENFVSIVDQALDYTLKFESVISPNQGAILSATIDIYECLSHRQSRTASAQAMLLSNRRPEILWSSIEMIHRNRATNEPLLVHQCKEEWSKLVVTKKTNLSQEIGFVCPEQVEPVGFWKTFDKQPQGSINLTMSGAFCSKVWWTSSRNFQELSSAKTILFMTLSSYLSERTGDPTIKLEAIRSAKCIRKHMLDSTTFLAKDCIFDADNSREKENATLSCHLTGIAIEGFTVLADITGSDDWRKLAISMAQNAMATSQWHGRDGILLVGSESKLYINDDLKALKGLLARGLLTLYQRNPTNKPLRNSIRKYINVQFNALVDLASHGNAYGVDWRGPFVGPYIHGQLAAFELLVAAFGVNFT